MMLSQGLLAGLGAKHRLVEKLSQFWADSVEQWTKGSQGGWDSDDEAGERAFGSRFWEGNAGGIKGI